MSNNQQPTTKSKSKSKSNSKSNSNSNSNSKLHPILFIPPGLMTIIPEITQSYGVLSMWCWITDADPEMSAVLEWVYYYLWVFATTIILVVLTGIPLRKWKRIARNPNKRQLAIRMMMFPVVWVVCKMPAMMNRAYQLCVGVTIL